MFNKKLWDNVLEKHGFLAFVISALLISAIWLILKSEVFITVKYPA